MGEAVQSGEALYDYRDGLSVLRNPDFIQTQLDAEQIVNSMPYQRHKVVEEQIARLDEHYRKLAGHPTKDQRVVAKARKFYPVTKAGVELSTKSNYAADHPFTAVDMVNEGEFILEGISMAYINSQYQMTFKMHLEKQQPNAKYSHYHMTFQDIDRLDFTEQLTFDLRALPTELDKMNKEAYVLFEMYDYEDNSVAEQKRTAENMQRAMTRRLKPLIDTNMQLMLSSPHYYSARNSHTDTPEITDETYVERSDNNWDIIAGRALRVAVKKDYVHEPYTYKPFLVVRNDKNNVNYAIPADQTIDVFTI